MKNNKNNKLAFSLIELSVVILIIGILILGVTKGSRLITESKIKTAQSLTSSSPVTAISGLALWLESTMDESFAEGEAIDTALLATGTIAIWNDINPRVASSRSAGQDTADNRPRYIESGINGLPSVNFDGDTDTPADNDFLTISTAESLGMVNSDYEIFIVYQGRALGSGIHFLLSGSHEQHEMNVSVEAGTLTFIPNVNPTTTATAENSSFPGAHIASARISSNTSIARVDGVDGVTNAAAARSLDSGDLRIGARADNTFPLNGEIGEVIIFNRVLKVSERDGVEEYLSAKWGIELR